ncbi:imidazole glycerol phosphate synthase hisHF [Ophiocordyceps sinensis CO18]|uniref:Imidazole glycerol phosphate synthase hisHF n=1 Tax=Ophiocordyceps sinensis (strain Co18 / CGMCC 3.14243) TaxID=911162 RepID=T5AH74_OPHSC|nr:imidazole glycerol phosphate synthase hisHF [Ophiocordyceps sinensis CO18]
MPTVHLLDYVAGNIRSLVNAIEKLGYQVDWITSPEDVPKAEKLILPGVGHFGHCLSQLAHANYLPAINKHIEAGKPFMGICVGLQALFEGSLEDPGVHGLGIIKGSLGRFDDSVKSVPHIGWNSANTGGRPMYDLRPDSKYYYVHTYKFPYVKGELEAQGWTVATGTYGSETFVGAVARGNVYATQFHPEKSGVAGLRTIRAFLTGEGASSLSRPLVDGASSAPPQQVADPFAPRLLPVALHALHPRGHVVVGVAELVHDRVGPRVPDEDVVLVSPEGERAPGLDDAGQLGPGSSIVEPVGRLAGDDHVDGAVGHKGEMLGAALPKGDVGIVRHARRLLDHAGAHVDAHSTAEAGAHLSRDEAMAASQVEEEAFGRVIVVGQDCLEEGGRI